MTRVLKNGNVLLADGLQQTDVLFDESGILKIGRGLDGDEVIDCTGLTVLPGLVDVHVHLREPGYEHKETIATGSKAAAHGGFTTIFAMPNLNPFPSDAERMKAYLEKIRTDAAVRVIPYGTITDDEKGRKPTDYASLKELGIRWFSDDGVGVGEEKVMEAAMRQAKEAGVMFACHTEDMHYRTPGACVHDSEYGISMGWKGIPSLCESAQFARDLMLAQYIGVKYHGCHISARESVEALAKAKANGADASAEVTAHHLLLEDTDVKGPNWKMNPPLRSHADRMALIAGLESGVLDFIASDHAPHTAADKNKAMADSAFGIVSLETSFAMLYTEFVYRTKRWSLRQLVEWMSYLPARRFGLEKTGRIEEGWRSDFAIVDLNHERIIDKDAFFSKGKNTPFDGCTVHAGVVHTIVEGKSVYQSKEDCHD